MRRILFLLFLLVSPLITIHAQDESSQEGWEIIQREINEMLPSTDEIPFEGTILSIGEQGIYGLNYDWDTRRILAFRPNDTRFSFLSPDGNYWVTLQGRSFCIGSCGSSSVTIEEMIIHDLISQTRDVQVYNWSFYTPYRWREPVGSQDTPLMNWISPTQFIYAKDLGSNVRGDAVIFSTETGTLEPYETSLQPDELHYLSPDLSLRMNFELVITPTDDSYITTRYTQIVDNDTNEIVWTSSEGVLPAQFLTSSAWSPDSNYILLYERDDNDYTFHLVDRVGNLYPNIANIRALNTTHFYYFYTEWSPDSRFLSITFHTATPSDECRYMPLVIDVDNHQTFETCLSGTIRSTWSPDSLQLAFQSLFDDNLYILDIESFQLYGTYYNPDARPSVWRP